MPEPSTMGAVHGPCLIVFDLDGTLVDSRRDLADATNLTLESYGASPLPVDRVAAMVGEGARTLVERALAAAGLEATPVDEALARFRSLYDARLLVHTRPYDGIVDVVRAAAAAGNRLGVLTNKPEAPSKRLIDAFGLSPFFRWLIGGDSGFPRKPDPAGLRHLIAQAGVAPTSTLHVGDSDIDAATARAAGVRFCLARYGFGELRAPVVLQAGEWAVRSPGEIGALIDTLGG